MGLLHSFHHRFVKLAARGLFVSLALLVTRVALAGVFWRSGRTKIVEGTWFEISDTTHFLFENEYAGVPIPPEIAAPMAAFAEHFFPALLVLGLATRYSALALLGMTLVIQIFVYPDAWWSTHIVWAAMALILVTSGAGSFSLDSLIARVRGR
ncbi:MAG: DoxX family protein [Alphaproteobacteria bacterium]|nr:MAG: DoxX family protein [Alphaproteobacteria bacterium]